MDFQIFVYVIHGIGVGNEEDIILCYYTETYTSNTFFVSADWV